MVKTKKKNMVDNSDTKRLAVLIALAIVISLAGTVITLSSLPNGITGFATDSETGTAQFTVSALTQISLKDSTVNFGTCTLNSSATVVYHSNKTNGQSVSPDGGGTCSGSFPDNMTLENTGNKYVNVTVKSSLNAMNFTNSSSGTGNFYFVGIAKTGETSACPSANLTTTFTNFTAAATNYTLCRNLSPINTNDEIFIAYRIDLPPDTREQASKSTTITFTAEDCIQ